MVTLHTALSERATNQTLLETMNKTVIGNGDRRKGSANNSRTVQPVSADMGKNVRKLNKLQSSELVNKVNTSQGLYQTISK